MSPDKLAIVRYALTEAQKALERVPMNSDANLEAGEAHVLAALAALDETNARPAFPPIADVVKAALQEREAAKVNDSTYFVRWTYDYLTAYQTKGTEDGNNQ